MKKWTTIESLVSIYQQHQIKHHHVSEAEFCLVEMLDCSLIVYHPYRTLLQLRIVWSDPKKFIIHQIEDMKNASIQSAEQIYQDAWRVCNDSVKSDAALLYPPHMIAMGQAGIYMNFDRFNQDGRDDFQIN